ncbi:MAG: hypothetical protein HY885_15810 [Deltaproteobacteria bacterium]|nr:hypothetical protein [Deltaproteobacteria bacterium]
MKSRHLTDLPHKGLQTTLLLLALCTFLSFLAACATGSYGSLDFKISVEQIFESGQVLDNHTYYYIGPEAEPYAIMAIDNQFQLTPSLWKKIDLTPGQLKKWMDRIDNRYRDRNKYFGAVILDQDGNKIGLWYSWLTWTPIRRGEGNQIIIYTPDTTKNLNAGDKRFFFGQ